MKIRVINIIFLTILLFTSCSRLCNKSVRYFLEEHFDDEVLIDCIDEKTYYSCNYRIDYPVSLKHSGHCGVIFKKRIRKSEFNTLMKVLLDSSIYHSRLDSSDKLSPLRGRDRFIKENKELYAIPDIYAPYSDYKVDDFSSNTEILILETSEGYFVDYYDYGDEIIMSNIWLHGYSNGAIIDFDNHVILFWIIVW